MRIYQLFDINLKRKELLSFVGAGGKTTTIFKLAKDLKMLGKKVLVTTSTAIFYPEKNEFDRIIVSSSDNIANSLDIINKGTITVMGKEISKEKKLLGFSKKTIDSIYHKRIFDYILVEADGSKRKPIKFPAEHEPVIPLNTNKTIGVIGIDSIGKKINDENVHRAEQFCKVVNCELREEIDEEIIYKLIKNSKGLFKDCPLKSQKYILLNKVDNKELEKKALKIIEMIIKDQIQINGIIAADIISEKYLTFGDLLGRLSILEL